MRGARGDLLYVGKARNLRKRVGSYFGRRGLSARILALTQQVADIEVTVTHTETEALLLENTLIKRHHPHFNVLLRDDKGYPFIRVTTTHEFPAISFYRGARRETGRYFGPYPSTQSVRDSLDLLERVFRLRTCEDGVFAHRTRPCLKYQIRRCSAPCVGHVTKERYAEDVRDAISFLEGRSRNVIDDLARRMERASAALDFEGAAAARDRIAALKRIQEHQHVVGPAGEADIVALALGGSRACVQVAFIRGGAHVGDKSFFPALGADDDESVILGSFLAQYYLGREMPPRIYVSIPPPDRDVLENAFSEQAGARVRILGGMRGEPRHWVGMARQNAVEALGRHLASKAGQAARLDAVADALGLPQAPVRIECFDISHTQGEAAVGACVVFQGGEPASSLYRRFNIRSSAAGDDYAALHEAVLRRFARSADKTTQEVPDLLLIDGGAGQVAAAVRALEIAGVAGIPVVGVAKGPARRAGDERLFLAGSLAGGAAPLVLGPGSPALHLIQAVRDEAHRFAITGHRGRRSRARVASTLEQIPGVGERRRQSLLKAFGGLRGVSGAAIEDLAGVPGISRILAQKIYDNFHGGRART